MADDNLDAEITMTFGNGAHRIGVFSDGPSQVQTVNVVEIIDRYRVGDIRWIFGVFSCMKKAKEALDEAGLGHLLPSSGTPHEYIQVTLWNLNQARYIRDVTSEPENG